MGVSDLLNNLNRGILAEFLVARALGLDNKIRDAWDAYDLQTLRGTKIEVKSGSYLQSWNQKGRSKVVFRCPPTHAWLPTTNEMDDVARRQADVYVFAMLHHQNKTTVEPMNLAQWEFYVIPMVTLERLIGKAHSVPLQVLAREGKPVTFSNLRKEITRVEEIMSSV